MRIAPQWSDAGTSLIGVSLCVFWLVTSTPGLLTDTLAKLTSDDGSSGAGESSRPAD